MQSSIDPITVEVLGNAFAALVEEMGLALIKASYSTNIKERRDCSTTLFDAEGQTLAQAEHIPIHLGSLLGIVEAIRQRYAPDAMHPGDMFVGNDAYTGALQVHRYDGREPDRASLLRPGDALSVVTPGAGGYGDPRQRSRDLVRRDLQEGKIPLRAATELYGMEQEDR